MSKDRKDGVTDAGFPEFHGMPDEIEHFRAQLERYKAAAEAGTEFQFEAELPYIIGYVSHSEREAFNTFYPAGESSDSESVFDTDRIIFQHQLSTIPGIRDKITADIALLDEPGLEPKTLLVKSSDGRVSNYEDESLLWHTDPPYPLYLVSNKYASEFYNGPALYKPGSEGPMVLDRASLDSSVQAVQAPPFAIVRVGPFNVHRKPKFTKQRKLLNAMTGKF